VYWQVLQINVQPGRRADLLQISKPYVEECVREEPGALGFTFLLDEQDEDRYCAIEQYADRAAQLVHAQGAVIQRRGPEILPLLAGPPVLLASGDQFDL
jgi:quinol monooxygenase YgiN